MKVVKESYEKFIQRENENVDSPLAAGIKNRILMLY